nr:hypothetical protein [uncultured Parabacteroides sp.]
MAKERGAGDVGTGVVGGVSEGGFEEMLERAADVLVLFRGAFDAGNEVVAVAARTDLGEGHEGDGGAAVAVFSGGACEAVGVDQHITEVIARLFRPAFFREAAGDGDAGELHFQRLGFYGVSLRDGTAYFAGDMPQGVAFNEVVHFFQRQFFVRTEVVKIVIIGEKRLFSY